jgi:uncharacterized NAD-dependent epimerase/dehydratase family protein
MDGKAVLLTQGMLDSHSAKTAHGLIRGTERYEVVAVLDHEHAGKDAGVVLDGVAREIPVHASIDDFTLAGGKADYLIIGVATKGGFIPAPIREELKKAVSYGLSIVNGLHEYLSEDHEMKSLAEKHKVQLIDIRKPRPKEQLKFWEGTIEQVKCPKIAVLGTDCAIGKRTTARILMEAARDQGLRSEMIFTGQTGWLQGAKYGFIFDSTYNDFVSGELEHAIVSCYHEVSPDIIFLEGQASLQNPTGPCGAEFLLSGRADGVILQHAPGRKYFGDEPLLGEIPPLDTELELIRLYGSKVIAITLNTKELTPSEADEVQVEYQEKYGIPVFQPLKDEVHEVISLIQQAHAKN